MKMRLSWGATLLLIILTVILAACAQPGGSIPETGTEETPEVTNPPGTNTEEPVEETEMPVPEPSPTGDSPALHPPAALAAQEWLAEQQGVPVEQVEIGESTAEEWPDGCLGLAGPDEMCTQVIVPGWRITFQVNGQIVAVRTNQDGTVVRLEDPLGGAVRGGVKNNPLAGTAWELVSFGPLGAEQPVIGETTLTLQFEPARQAGGSSGCNHFGGQYQVEEDSISFSDLISTMMACEKDVMDQEGRYLGALQSSSRFELTATELTIWYDSEQAALHFVR